MEDLLKNNLLVDNKLSYENLDVFCNKVEENLNIKFSPTKEEVNSLIAFLRLSTVYLYLYCCEEDFVIASIYKLLDLISRYNAAFDLLIERDITDPRYLNKLKDVDISVVDSLKKHFDSLRLNFPSDAHYKLSFAFLNIEQESIKCEE